MDNQDTQLVSVYETGDLAMLGFAKSIIESEGIRCVTQGEDLQDLFGWGRIGLGFDAVTGPAQLLVEQSCAERATALLSNLKK